MRDPYKIIIQPLLTERSTDLREDHGKYSFWVDLRANKVEIKHAIEAIFPGVRVLAVNTMTIHGSRMRVRGNRKGKKPDWKKAIIMLRPDDKIDIYEGI